MQSPHISDISCFLPVFGFWFDTFVVGKGAWLFSLLRFVARSAPRGGGRVALEKDACSRVGQDALCASASPRSSVLSEAGAASCSAFAHGPAGTMLAPLGCGCGGL